MIITNNNKRSRPKLKILIKYNVYFAIRLLSNKKNVHKKTIGFSSLIKNKIISSINKKISGWYYLKIKISRNNLFVISKNIVYINKKFKILLLCKQKFRNMFFLTDHLIRYLFKHNNNNSVFKKLIFRVDFLLLRIFSFSTLFFTRKLILRRFIKIVCIKKYIIDINFLIKPGNLICVIKHIFHPKIKSYNLKITSFKFFDNSNLFLLFGVDINYRTQSFIINFDFIFYFEIFSIFFGSNFSRKNLFNFYNR